MLRGVRMAWFYLYYLDIEFVGLLDVGLSKQRQRSMHGSTNSRGEPFEYP
jgi:hypothetical protein